MADATQGGLAGLESWLSGLKTKIEAGLPAFEKSVATDFESAKTAVAAYGGPLAAELVDVAKFFTTPAELQQFATAFLPTVEAKIVAGLAAVGVSGAAATAIAQQAASALVTSIVTAVSAALVAPK